MTPTTTMPDTNLPEELFCKCKNGKPCFDTLFNIEKWHAQAITEAREDEKKALETYKAELIEKIEGKRRSEDEEIGNDDWSGNYNEALDDVLAIIKEK